VLAGDFQPLTIAARCTEVMFDPAQLVSCSGLGLHFLIALCHFMPVAVSPRGKSEVNAIRGPGSRNLPAAQESLPGVWRQ
jgi:hypothetical protein